MDKITNLRSLGGYKTNQNTQIKDGLLFRSGQLYKLTNEQKTYMEDQLKIKKIIDMRGSSEREQFPDSVWNNCEYETLDILEDATINNASLDNMIAGIGDTDKRMLSTYTQLAISPSAKKYYHQFIKELIDFKKPIVFHCFAGKDRTGIGAVIILKILGVSDDTIIHDYLLTNIERKDANQQILFSLKDKLSKEQLSEVKTALLVKDTYLLHYYDVIKENFNSFDNYLYKGLNLTDDNLNKFRNIYTTNIK